MQKEDKSFGYGSTGKKSWNRKFDDYGEEFAEGDVIGCLLDREVRRGASLALWHSKLLLGMRV